MIPAPIRFLLLRAARYFTFMTLARVVMTARFAHDLPAASIRDSLLLGARFDLRLVAILTLAAAPFALVPACAPAGERRRARLVWAGAESLLALALTLVVFADFGHYAYLVERLNGGVITLLKDPREALGMVWQSYPVVTLAFAAAALTALMLLGHRLERRALLAAPASRKRTAFATLALALAGAGLIHGRFGQYPLRWSETSTLTPPVAGAMALNPALHFYDTLIFARGGGSRPGDDLPTRELMRARLGADGSGATPYERRQPGSAHPLPAGLNVVLVVMESFSGYRSSVFGNPLNPTPVMAKLADEGVSFRNHFTAHPGTARGVFTLVTGVPDVQLGDTASRNPRAARHRFALEDLGFAEKHYFIGGSTRWANVRGVLTGTIPGLKIHEEDDLRSARTDVWGVADGDLLPEAAMRLAKAKRPFFAIIQTASNHRPYSIPDHHLPYVPRITRTREQLDAAGFEDDAQADGFRYMDWSVGRLMEEAKRAGWADDTLFVFVGDHGITGKAGVNMPEAWRVLPFTTGHTPLILHCPKHLRPAVVSTPCMQADVLPTVAALFGKPTVQRGIGRDALAPDAARDALAFMIDHQRGPELAVFDGRFHAVTGPKPDAPVRLHDTTSADIARDVAATHPDIARRLGELARAHYHTAAYMLVNNGAPDAGAAK